MNAIDLFVQAHEDYMAGAPVGPQLTVQGTLQDAYGQKKCTEATFWITPDGLLVLTYEGFNLKQQDQVLASDAKTYLLSSNIHVQSHRNICQVLFSTETFDQIHAWIKEITKED